MSRCEVIFLSVDNSAISGDQLIRSPHPALSETGTGVEAEIGAGVDQEARLRKPIRHIEAAGRGAAVACRH
jgi:hypothetical protein